MQIDDKVEQYRQLKKSKKALEKKLIELKKQILPYVMHGAINGIEAQERNLTTYNEEELHRLMNEKGIRNSLYCSYVVDELKIEELWLNGALTDDDLRRIRVPSYTYALVETSGKECTSEA